MQFFAIVAAFAAVAVAQYSAAPVVAESSCSSLVTVTVTATLAHTPSAPGSAAPTGPAPYPSSLAVVPSAYPVGTGVDASTVPAGTGYPVAPTGTATPSGTVSGSAPYPEFTGAASSLKMGGVVAGVGAVAALFL